MKQQGADSGTTEEQIGPSAASLRLIALLGHHYATFNGGIGLTNSLSTHAAAISNAFDLSLVRTLS